MPSLKDSQHLTKRSSTLTSSIKTVTNKGLAEGHSLQARRGSPDRFAEFWVKRKRDLALALDHFLKDSSSRTAKGLSKRRGL